MTKIDVNVRTLDGESLHFSRLDALARWFDTEAENWSWLSEVDDQLTRDIKKPFEVYPRLAARRAHELMGDPESETAKNELNNATKALNVQIDQGKYLFSTDGLGKFVCSIADGDPELAAAVLTVNAMPSTNAIASNVHHMKGAAALAAYELGISKKSATSSVRKSQGTEKELQRLVTDYAQSFADNLDDFERLNSTSRETIEEVSSLFMGALEDHRRLLDKERIQLRKSYGIEVKVLTDDTKGKLAQIREYYETELALQGPISYWKSKLWWHRFSTFIFAVVFLAYSSVLVFLSVRYARSFDGGFSGFVEYWSDAQIGAVGIFALMFALVLIFSRIIYRLFASQLHLWNDASERITMTQTYLALAEKGHINPEFMGALIGRLFAPASDGVVRDDFGSIGPFDALTKKMSS